MNAPEDPRIWHGLRAHLDDLGSVATVPPIGVILDPRRSRRPLRVVAGIAGAAATVLAIGFLLRALRPVAGPVTGATPRPSPAPATPAALPTPAPVDGAELIGHSYVAIEVTDHGQPLALVAETHLLLGFSDASHFGASAGCNGMGGAYQILGGRLMTANMYVTAMACLGPVMRQEGWYYTFLRSSPMIGRESRGLVLSTDDAVVTYLDAAPTAVEATPGLAFLTPFPPQQVRDALVEADGIGIDPLSALERGQVDVSSDDAIRTALASRGVGVPGPNGSGEIAWTSTGFVYLATFTPAIGPGSYGGGHAGDHPAVPAYLVQLIAPPIAGYPGFNTALVIVDAQSGDLVETIYSCNGPLCNPR